MGNKDYIGLKIRIPRVSQKVLRRTSITKIIDNASLDQMIYLVAPFGCGKTMSIISWLMEHGGDTAWVSLEKNDDSATSLWGLLSAAIMRFAGEIEKAESVMTNPSLIKNPRGFLTETLIRLSPKISNKVLVIDNFKYIHDDNLLHSLKALFEKMLGCWRIIVIGRNELPPLFNDYLLKKRVRLITLHELDFNIAEIAEYFVMNGHDVNKEELALIHEETGGWPAALNAILSAPHNGSVRYTDLAKEYVTKFFESEIWGQMDEKLKSLLLKTAILEKLTPSLCYYVAGLNETNQILRKLYADGIFITKLDDSESYCWHRVFRDFLLRELENSGIDINSLYVKAGWWMYERNESIQALLYFYKAGYIYGINQAFKKVKPADMGMEKYLEAAGCLKSLDILDLKEHPSVAVRIALLHFIMDNIAETKRIYQIVTKWIKPGILSIPPEEYIDFTWEVGWLRYVNPDVDIFFDKRFEEWINLSEYAPHLIDNDRSRASALRLPSVLRGFRDFSAVTDKAEEYYKKNSEAEYKVVRDKDCLFVMDLVIAEISYEREEFLKAEKMIKAIMPAIERQKMTELYFVCTVLLVKISRATQQSTEIDTLTERVNTQIVNNGHFFLLPNFHAFEQRNRLANGVTGATEIFLEENLLYKDKPYYYLIYRQLTFVRVLLSEAKYRESILLLGNLELLCSQYDRNMDLIEISILRSVAEYGIEHNDEAYWHFKTALDAGKRSGFIRIFSDDAISLWPILSLVRKRDMNAYVKKVIASCKNALVHAGITTRVNENHRDTLTNKETEILMLLQSGMTNQEIAFAKNISSGTVKTHLHSIYAKLGVNGRTAALAMAENLGIFKGKLHST